MQPRKNRTLIYSLLLGIWVFAVAWQFEEHARVVDAARLDLRNRSHEIASTLSAVTRALAAAPRSVPVVVGGVACASADPS